MPFADNDGTRIHYREVGRGPDTMLLIMGLGGSGNAWWRLLPHLESRVRLLVMDNRGTGRSDPVRGLLGLRDLVEDALAVLDHAGVASAHVHGVSMGGMVAQHLALDHPDRVQSLLLGCTAAQAQSGQPPWRLLASSFIRPVLGPGRSWPVLCRVLYAPQTFESARDRIAEDLEMRMKDGDVAGDRLRPAPGDRAA